MGFLDRERGHCLLTCRPCGLHPYTTPWDAYDGGRPRFAQAMLDAGVTIPSITTLNSPHLGGPAYDVARDPTDFLGPVTEAWGDQYADLATSLIEFERTGGAGAIQVLVTSAHVQRDPESWDARQVGVLDGVELTLIAGDYCGETCGDARSDLGSSENLRTDGTVPVYIPPGMVPEATVTRVTFPTLHSTFAANELGLPAELSVSRDSAAADFLVRTTLERWQAAGALLLS